MTVVEFYHKGLVNILLNHYGDKLDKLDKDVIAAIWNLKQEAKVMYRKQVETIVLDLLHHDLGHDNTASWLANLIELGEHDLLEGYETK